MKDQLETISEELCKEAFTYEGVSIPLAFPLIFGILLVLLVSWCWCCCCCRKKKIKTLRSELTSAERARPLTQFQMVGPSAPVMPYSVNV